MLVLALTLAMPGAQDRAVFPSDDPPPERSARNCRGSEGEIVVCAPPAIDMEAAARRFEPRPLRPDFKLPGGGTGTVQAVQREFPGAVSQGAMVTVKIPIGRKKPKQDD